MRVKGGREGGMESLREARAEQKQRPSPLQRLFPSRSLTRLSGYTIFSFVDRMRVEAIRDGNG